MNVADIERLLAREGLAGHDMEGAVYDGATSSDVRHGEEGDYSLFDLLPSNDSVEDIVEREELLAKFGHLLEEDDEPEEDLQVEAPEDDWGDFLASL